MANIAGAAAMNAAGATSMTGRLAQCVNGAMQSHLSEISATTNAAMIGSQAETLVHAVKRNALAALNILNPILGNGNTCSEFWTRNLSIPAFMEAVRLMEEAYHATINRELDSNFLKRGFQEFKRSIDPVRLHEIVLPIPYHTKNKRMIANEPVSIPYTYHMEDGSEVRRYLWFYPFVSGGELYKIEVWTDRKLIIDLFKGFSTETLNRGKDLALYMLIPTNVSKVSIPIIQGLGFYFTRCVNFVKKIAEKHQVHTGIAVSWLHHNRQMLEIAPHSMVVIYRDTEDASRAVFAVPIGGTGCVNGYEFYFCGGIEPKRFIDKMFSDENLEAFINDTSNDDGKMPTEYDELKELFSEDNQEYIKERDRLFSLVKLSFDNSWRNKFFIKKRANLSKLTI